MKEEANAKLGDTYRRWLEELKITAPQLLGEKYSNPYFSSIPENWFESAGPRILVVGEEGFGSWGCGKGDGSISADEIDKIQALNFNYLKKQLFDLPTGEINNSAFWRRFRKVAENGVCSWTNIDKIHVLHSKKCVLSKLERELLHMNPVKILREEIEVLNPTHVIFFGWHGESLKQQLPEVYTMLYPGGPKDNSLWFQDVVAITFNGRTYIFCYHPNWGYRSKGYEEKVITVLKDNI